MDLRSMTRDISVALVVITFAVTSPGLSQAGNLFPVESGYDLFRTLPGATFHGIAFQGVPIGSFDFGSGLVNTSLTDTIVLRTQDVLAAGGTTNLSIKALQLKSVSPVTVASLVNETLFVTLNALEQVEWEQENASNNLMTIGTNKFATSNFRAYFDFRTGGVDGVILNDPNLFPDPEDRYVDLSGSNNPWANEAPNYAFLIDGINHHLNGFDETGDFWPVGVLHTGPHPVTSTPEPSTFVMAALGVFGLGFVHRRRRSTVS